MLNQICAEVNINSALFKMILLCEYLSKLCLPYRSMLYNRGIIQVVICECVPGKQPELYHFRARALPLASHKHTLTLSHMHILTTQTLRAFVVFIHLLLIKNAFLILGEDPIYISRGSRREERVRETKESMGRRGQEMRQNYKDGGSQGDKEGKGLEKR